MAGQNHSLFFWDVSPLYGFTGVLQQTKGNTKSCEINLDLKLVLCHIPSQSALLWATLPPWPIRCSFCCKRECWEYLNWIWITIWRRPFSISNVLLATGTTTDPYSLQQALKHTICCTSCPPHTSSAPFLFLLIFIYSCLYRNVSPPHIYDHTDAHTRRRCGGYRLPTNIIRIIKRTF